MTTHDFSNHSDLTERQRVERDTYLTRAQADADLGASGRFKREITTRVTGVPTYPQLPASSPWSNGFDVNVEPPLGYAVDAMPQEIQSSEPALSPATVVASLTDAGDRTGGEPVIGSTVAHFPATDEPVIGSSMKRRKY